MTVTSHQCSIVLLLMFIYIKFIVVHATVTVRCEINIPRKVHNKFTLIWSSVCQQKVSWILLGITSEISQLLQSHCIYTCCSWISWILKYIFATLISRTRKYFWYLNFKNRKCPGIDDLSHILTFTSITRNKCDFLKLKIKDKSIWFRCIPKHNNDVG